MRKKILFFAVLFVMVAVVYRMSVFSPELVSFSGPTMGTTYTVKFFSTEEVDGSSGLKDDVDAALVKVNKLMSTYDPNSELSLFNKLPAGQSATISEDMAYVIDKALLISEMSGGEYDVTIGPLVNLWGFGPGKREDKVPSQAQIDEAKSLVGYRLLSLDGRRLSKDKDIYVDLSSIAKGYGVDVVAKVLEAQGVDSYLVEVGGEIVSKGMKADGSPWRIAIESPAGGHDIAERVIAITNVAVATSGDYRNYFEKNGVRYSHTISPVTGKPITHKLVSVTVVEKTTTMADGLATAITVLGPDKGLEFAQKNGIAAYLLVKTDFGFEERSSDAFKPYLN
ncbi:MAG: FAD:protein FMN transferase [Marinomonas sp.]|jgi:FAD:protein FMN transferase|uniref:FAD:protein FMN transferase n=1 Tax=Marinomonas pontica TaxID=264739 RepID=A0ABN6WKX7_9GAMM|nr:FAD:protein FMN transferase [Marinomonas pontica]MCW8356491.1 FAD:protein FMN transferase [Marinomonas pontica]BDX02457.1 FAD:protein FMN transferase [Marinomonas pontica]